MPKVAPHACQPDHDWLLDLGNMLQTTLEVSKLVELSRTTLKLSYSTTVLASNLRSKSSKPPLEPRHASPVHTM
jgi:hypothetical protein